MFCIDQVSLQYNYPMKNNSIDNFREKSFRKFTFTCQNIFTPLGLRRKSFHNPFNTFQQSNCIGDIKNQNQGQKQIKYKSCEKVNKGIVFLPKKGQELKRKCKILISCKSLSSTEHDDETEVDQKKYIYNQLTNQSYSPLVLSKKSTQTTQNSQVQKSDYKHNNTNNFSGILSLSKVAQKILSKDVSIKPPNIIKSYKVLRFSGKPEVFEVVKFIDSGSFGQVFLVRHIITKMIFCLKSINKSKLSDKNYNQLIQQIKIQSHLNHPNIIKLYGYTSDSSNIYLLLQASLGTSLYRLLQNTAMKESIVKEHVKKICQAVDYLHDKNIIHRDIKSENVLFDQNTIKICDFGWAVHSPLLRSTISGTPVYTPPQIIKMQEYGNKVDVWCVGILTYQLLYGKLPFQIRYQKDFKKIIDENVTFPKNKEVSQSAKQFIQLCLRKQPTQRYTLKQLLSHNFLTRRQ